MCVCVCVNDNICVKCRQTKVDTHALNSRANVDLHTGIGVCHRPDVKCLACLATQKSCDTTKVCYTYIYVYLYIYIPQEMINSSYIYTYIYTYTIKMDIIRHH